MSHTVSITPQPHPRSFAARCTCGWVYSTNALKWVVLGMQAHYVQEGMVGRGPGQGLVVDTIAGDGLEG